jgi:ankyrin repeat protein
VTGLDDALDAFYQGDRARLEALLDADPSLVAARVERDGGHYCGYFHRATLLHHVPGNPAIRPLPPETVELATLLLDRGAAVDAVTAPGPAQPHDIGWTPLGLAATSADARDAGVQRALIDLFLARGADIDARNGGPLMGALYYGEADAAAMLVDRGAHVDLPAAAGLGRIDLMERLVVDRAPHVLVHYSMCVERPRSRAEVLALALTYAAMGGHTAAVAWLLDAGAGVNAVAPFDHEATALHWAALRGHEATARLLLDRGADRTLRDVTHDGDPAGWADHAGHTALVELLRVR